MTCDPKALLAAAACYQCVPRQVWQSSVISLLCWWSNHLTPQGCGTPSNTFVLSGGGYPGINTTFNKFDATTWIDIGAFFNVILNAGTWTIVDTDLFHILYSTPDADFPCEWTVVEPTAAPAPTGQYV